MCAKFYLKYVSCLCSAVHKIVGWINGNTLHNPSQLAHLAVSGPDLSIRTIKVPHTQVVVTTSNKHIRAIVEKLGGQGSFCCSWTSTDSLASLYIPDNELVVVTATKGSQQRLIGRECQIANCALVKNKFVDDFIGFQIPNDDKGLRKCTGV